MADQIPVADQSSRDAALDVSQSIIVQAPAGSGKTELLTQRILKLLSLVHDPEEVLAITFTRKAAGEMRDRLLSCLSKASREDRPASAHEARSWDLARKVLEIDSQRGWHIAEHPARLRILTIDALNSALTRQMPLLSKVGAQLDISTTPEVLYAEAATATIELLGSDHPCAADLHVLLAHVDNRAERVIELLAKMLSKREQWLRHILPAQGNDRGRTRLENAIAAMVSSELELLTSAVPPDLLATVHGFATTSAAKLADQGGDSPLQGLIDIPELSNDADSLAAWQALAHLLLTAKDEWRRTWDKRLGFPPGEKDRKADFAELVSRLAEVDGLREMLAVVRSLPETTLKETQWRALRSLITVLPVAAAQLELVFRRYSKVDYTAVSRAALDALGGAQAPTDLALSLDYRIQHILVDEFQDTSASQFELIEQLIAGWTPEDGRTLFCVGDPMQSIYRFREAEVSLFLRAWQEGIGDVALKPVSLSVNFRSQAGIVKWVNQNFPAIMPPRADLQTAAVPFTRSDAFHPASEGDAVVFHPLIDQGPQDEAELVARLVLTHREASPDASIAILVSGRNHLRQIMPALRAAGLLPQAVEIEKLERQRVVHDLVALTRALLHRGDRTAWLAVLRAPWCGLSQEDLHVLASGDARPCIAAALEDEELLAGLTESGARRVTRFKGALWPVLNSAERGAFRDWIEGAWRRLGGPACLTDANELSNAEAFFELLQSLHEGRGLDDPLVLEQRLSKLYASADADADKNLLIMTIHKAKGLQFDVVIVPGLSRLGAEEDRPLLRWTEFPRKGGRTDLVLAPITGSDEDNDKLERYIADLERRRRILERARLLYVAVTRAQEKVHLIAGATTKEQGGERVVKPPDRRSMLDTLWPVASNWLESAAAGSSARSAADAETEVATVGATLFRLPEQWHLPDVPAAVAVTERLQARTVINEDAVSFDWAGQTARHVGTVVHEALRFIAGTGKKHDAKQLAKRAHVRLQELGTRGSDLQEAVRTVVSAIEVSCKDERGSWILFGAHDSARNELALSSVEDGVVHNLILDRTFIDENGVRWIIDYKVGVHEGADKQSFFDQELARYRQQLERYALTMARYEKRPVRTALYFPLYAGWREWDPFVAGVAGRVQEASEVS
ncbi:MAG: UvrD-helicase domain-containing protein [Gammaproteobacteria bacterium]|nr:UvrD-helicase domain-containing protein [Gammaproteobacteria bacterium]